MMLDEHGNDMTHPLYGGCKMPQWYSDKFNPPRQPLHDEMPAWMQKEIEREFGK